MRSLLALSVILVNLFWVAVLSETPNAFECIGGKATIITIELEQ